MKNTLPLHLSHVQKSSAIINISHTLLHSLALMALIYYRASFFFQPTKFINTPICLWLLIFSGELILSFIWLLGQAYRARKVSRTVYPERLPEDRQLPAIDVFICTADPSKEPTVEVMNTVISAMALDYPPEKLHVYLSDDGGSSVTLNSMREAWRFAKCWIPFCRAYGIKTRCPQAYFLAQEDNNESSNWGSEFMAEKDKIKEKYENFKDCVMRIRENASIMDSRDHSAVVEVMNDEFIDEGGGAGKVEMEMPVLVYVSREKRPLHPHHFKAGALNVLLRVSAVISNSPYILGLDCDMYCNDPTSARQAMCFHLDPKLSPSLAFVQFPQKFHNISDTDIYDSQLRSAFKVQLRGMDGVGGSLLAGTGFYIKRSALFATPMMEDLELMKLKQSFGTSNEFIKSLGRHQKSNDHKDFSSVGFLYFSVVEDYFTSLINLHSKGWTSVYCEPKKPAFLGAGTTNLNDLLVQSTRWTSGLVDVGISKFCPLIYGPKKMSALHAMCYGEFALHPFYFLPLWCFATIPQLCLLNGIPLYPEVSNGFFIVFSFIFFSSQSKHIQEVLSTGGSMRSWRNEQRMWMIKSVTCHLYGSLDAIMKRLGVREASFLPTNKVVDDERSKLYQMGKFDFQTSTMLLAPVVILVILNLISFIGGVTRAVVMGNLSEMFVQVFLSFFVVSMSYPVVEGMVLRKDKGRIPPSVTILSLVISLIFLFFGTLILE